MNDDPLRICRTCRFCQAIPDGQHRPLLYCTVHRKACQHPCPAYEREPGTEGDDD
jgi:hypothetical protein